MPPKHGADTENAGRNEQKEKRGVFNPGNGRNAELMAEMSDRTSKAAQIFVAAFPILAVYPLLQRFFIKGIVMGSVKE